MTRCGIFAFLSARPAVSRPHDDPTRALEPRASTRPHRLGDGPPRAATGADERAAGRAHAPHHAPPEWIAKFKGKFDMGWNELRERIFANHLTIAVVV